MLLKISVMRCSVSLNYYSRQMSNVILLVVQVIVQILVSSLLVKSQWGEVGQCLADLGQMADAVSVLCYIFLCSHNAECNIVTL